jgi:hypothetical protein
MSSVCTEVLSHESFGITADEIVWVVDVRGMYTRTESEENSRTSSAECDFLLKEESKISHILCPETIYTSLSKRNKTLLNSVISHDANARCLAYSRHSVGQRCGRMIVE